MRYFGLILIGTILFWMGCNEDSIITGEEIVASQGISGTFMVDTNGDGVYDSPLVGEKVILIDTWCSAFPISETYTDSLGDYAFNGVSTDVDSCSDVTVMLSFDFENFYYGDIGTIDCCYDIIAQDNTPDGDVDEEGFGVTWRWWDTKIGVSLDMGEYDDGNDFRARVYLNEASGYVLYDTDGDGIGDTPFEGAYVFFEMNDAPIGSHEFSRAATTDANGFYFHKGLKTGGYSIYVTGPHQITILEAADASPDPDGADNGTDKIDLVIGDNENDTDNNFVIEFN